MQGPFQDHKLNRLHQGTARLVIGNIPISFEEHDAPPSESVNALITSFTIPGLELEYETQAHYKSIVHIPVSEDNSYKGKILIVNMILDDRQENYWTIWRYMETIRSGRTGGYPVTELTNRIFGNDKQYRNRLTWIPRIDIVMGDDSNQRHQRLVFHRCYPLTLGELQMNFIDDAPVSVAVGFLFGMSTVERDEPPHEGLDAPKTVVGG